MPSTIEKLHRELKDKGLRIWAVNLQESRAQVAEWIRRKGVTVPVLLDADGAAAKAYRVTGTPTVVLVDRTGQWVGRGVGIRAWDGEKGRALIAALLSGGR